MYILTITYPRSKGSTFDFEYFRQTHLPEVGKAFGQFGLGYASVLKGEQGAKDAVASEGGKALAEDIANFTSCKPVMQFNSSVE